MSPTSKRTKPAGKRKGKGTGERPRSPAKPVDPTVDTDDTATMRHDWMTSVDVGDWKGLPNFCCKLCAFATVNRATAIEHHAEHFPPPSRVSPHIVDTGLVTPTGSKIARVVDTPAGEESEK